MTSSLYIPGYPLNQFIESFYYYEGYDPQHRVDRFLPDGNVQIIFDLTEEPKFIYDNFTLEEIQTCRRVWFSGFRTEPITIPSGRKSEMIIVQFHPGKAFPFLSEPMMELKNQVVPAEWVLDQCILDIRDQLMELKDIGEKLIFLEESFLQCYLDSPDIGLVSNYLIREIQKDPSDLRLNQVLEKVGYSQKHIIQLFKNQVGVTPKGFLRVMRFQKTVLEIEKNAQPEWTAIAHDCGFYDQSHFISDFKKFSGFRPSEYIRKKSDTLNYIPIQ